MADDDFLYFRPDPELGFYETVRAAVQFLIDNYWKNIGDQEMTTLVGVNSGVDENFHAALVSALSGTRKALAKFPQDSELPKLIPYFEHTIPIIGSTENCLISLIHGQEISTIQRRLGDEYSQRLYEQLVSILDSHLETHSQLLVAELVAILERYLTYVKELSVIYKEKEYGPNKTREERIRRRLSTLVTLLEEKIEALWLIGVMENADWA